MEILSVKDFRNNLAASFDRAAAGEQVLIRRKNSLYTLVCLGQEDVTLSPKKEREIDELIANLREEKMIEEGELPRKTT